MKKYRVSNEKHFIVVGLTYKKADERQRGRFSITQDKIEELILSAKEKKIVSLLTLSTCNRTELYAFSNHENELLELWADLLGQSVSELKKVSFVKKDFQAIEHFFRLSAGLESQIIGDFEIIGQIKKAAKNYRKKGTVNAFLERLVNTGIQLSKQIKQNTGLSSGSTSVAYAAANYILNNTAELSSKKILLFGTGKIGRNTCENLLKHTTHEKITLINRTEKKAEEISKKYLIDYRSIDQLKEEIHQADIIVVATGATQPTVNLCDVDPTKERLFIDLSIPFNVDEEIDKLPNTNVLRIDTISKTIEKSVEQRKNQIPQAERIVDEHVKLFQEWLETRKYAPYVQAFRNRLESIHQLESSKVMGNNCLQERELSLKVIQKLTNYLANHLRENREEADQTVELINKVFKV